MRLGSRPIRLCTSGENTSHLGHEHSTASPCGGQRCQQIPISHLCSRLLPHLPLTPYGPVNHHPTISTLLEFLAAPPLQVADFLLRAKPPLKEKPQRDTHHRLQPSSLANLQLLLMQLASWMKEVKNLLLQGTSTDNIASCLRRLSALLEALAGLLTPAVRESLEVTALIRIHLQRSSFPSMSMP